MFFPDKGVPLVRSGGDPEPGGARLRRAARAAGRAGAGAAARGHGAAARRAARRAAARRARRAACAAARCRLERRFHYGQVTYPSRLRI